MKRIYIDAIIILCLFLSYVFVYKKGFDAGEQSVYSEMYQENQESVSAMVKASKKILDLQATIGNNTDECFNRVWSDEIISAVNPELR